MAANFSSSERISLELPAGFTAVPLRPLGSLPGILAYMLLGILICKTRPAPSTPQSANSIPTRARKSSWGKTGRGVVEVSERCLQPALNVHKSRAECRHGRETVLEHVLEEWSLEFKSECWEYKIP